MLHACRHPKPGGRSWPLTEAEARPEPRPSTLRASNLSLVARTVIASSTPLSRSGVAGRTSMTRSTASRLVDELVAGGVLAELEPPVVSGPGRPSIPLGPGGRLAALGLQVNTGYLAARVIDLRGRVISEQMDVDDFMDSEPRETLQRLAGLGEAVLAGVPSSVRLVGAGLALPGVVSVDSGRLLLAPNLGWSDIHPGPLLGEGALRGIAVRIGNEADLAARTVAEVAPGRPAALSDFIYISGESGIGGAAVVDGRVMTVATGGRARSATSAWTRRAPGAGVVRRAAWRPMPDATPSLRMPGSRPGRRRACSWIGREPGTNAPSRRSSAATALGVALASVVNVLDIPAIVLGGHLGVISELLRPELEHQLQVRVVSSRWVAPTITTAAGDDAPGATGAAMLELDSVLAAPALWLR